MTEDFRIVSNPERDLGPLLIRLDSDHYKLVSDFDIRFPSGAPSLVDCTSLDIVGDFAFGGNVVARGEVRLRNESAKQVQIADGTVLEGEKVYE